jgi:hypothetical protein
VLACKRGRSVQREHGGGKWDLPELPPLDSSRVPVGHCDRPFYCFDDDCENWHAIYRWSDTKLHPRNGSTVPISAESISQSGISCSLKPRKTGHYESPFACKLWFLAGMIQISPILGSRRIASYTVFASLLQHHGCLKNPPIRHQVSVHLGFSNKTLSNIKILTAFHPVPRESRYLA